MPNEQYEVFDGAVDRAAIVATARRYLGVPYTSYASRVELDANGAIDKKRSKLSCVGFVFQVGKDLGILKAEYDINIVRPDSSIGWEETIQNVLLANCDEIDKEKSLPGDILRLRYSDINPTAPMHVSIKTTAACSPAGYHIHSINYDLGAAGGKVCENRLDLLEWRRVLSAHRLKGVVGV
jgi:hypothetical protein